MYLNYGESDRNALDSCFMHVLAIILLVSNRSSIKNPHYLLGHELFSTEWILDMEFAFEGYTLIIRLRILPVTIWLIKCRLPRSLRLWHLGKIDLLWWWASILRAILLRTPTCWICQKMNLPKLLCLLNSLCEITQEWHAIGYKIFF